MTSTSQHRWLTWTTKEKLFTKNNHCYDEEFIVHKFIPFMLPFKCKSLTFDIDKKIIDYVANQEPLMYWLFRSSDFFARLSYVISFSSVAFYVLFTFILHAKGKLTPPEEIVSVFATFMMASFSVLIVSFILREGLWSKLQPSVRDGVASLKIN